MPKSLNIDTDLNVQCPFEQTSSVQIINCVKSFTQNSFTIATHSLGALPLCLRSSSCCQCLQGAHSIHISIGDTFATLVSIQKDLAPSTNDHINRWCSAILVDRHSPLQQLLAVDKNTLEHT